LLSLTPLYGIYGSQLRGNLGGFGFVRSLRFEQLQAFQVLAAQHFREGDKQLSLTLKHALLMLFIALEVG
jgi:hypothetical protein